MDAFLGTPTILPYKSGAVCNQLVGGNTGCCSHQVGAGGGDSETRARCASHGQQCQSPEHESEVSLTFVVLAVHTCQHWRGSAACLLHHCGAVHRWHQAWFISRPIWSTYCRGLALLMAHHGVWLQPDMAPREAAILGEQTSWERSSLVPFQQGLMAIASYHQPCAHVATDWSARLAAPHQLVLCLGLLEASSSSASEFTRGQSRQVQCEGCCLLGLLEPTPALLLQAGSPVSNSSSVRQQSTTSRSQEDDTSSESSDQCTGNGMKSSKLRSTST